MNCYKCATPLPDQSRFCMACGADVSGEGHMHQTAAIEADPELLAALQTELGSEFTVERELGRGGMAIVYLGQDTHLGRKVAIKLLPPMLTFGAGPSLVERFKREARTAATLDHPNIIPVYRVSTGGKLFWYVMKYLQGESLDVLLKREGAMDLNRAIEILTQAADALDYAHQNNVVHRDIKPANIMLDKRGRVTVTDFGIAKALDTSGLTGSGATIGTPHYMSPEQCNGIGVSGASDQYSLAITAYQMFSGHVPFSSDSILELMRMHLMDPPPPLATLRPSIPAGIAAAVERGLAKTTEERFASCLDFARELARAAREGEAQARKSAGVKPELAPTTPLPTPPRVVAKVKEETAPRKPASTSKPPAPEPPAPTVIERRPSTSRTGWLIGGGAVALAAVVATVLFLKPDPPVQTPDRDTTTPVVRPQSNTGDPGDSARSPEAQMVAAPNLTKLPISDSARPTPAALDSGKAAAATRLASGTTKQPVRDTKQAVRDPGTRTVLTAPPSTKIEPAQPAAFASITVGSTPLSAITINGQAQPSNPMRNVNVPSGRVTIRFQVTDDSGVWAVDTIITVSPGEMRNLGRITLKRPTP